MRMLVMIIGWAYQVLLGCVMLGMALAATVMLVTGRTRFQAPALDAIFDLFAGLYVGILAAYWLVILLLVRRLRQKAGGGMSTWKQLLVLTQLAMPVYGLMQLRRYLDQPQATTPTCPDCGYDLRATPHRCPECGRSPAPAT